MKNENIVKDMSTGIMVVNKKGQISLMNEAMHKLLPCIDESKSLLQAIEYDEKNSSFYDLILDSAINRNYLKSMVVAYSVDHQTKHYDVRSRYVEDEESLIISITDITREIAYSKRCRDATIVSAGIISFIALWNIICAAWKTYWPQVNPHIMTILLLGLGCVVAFTLLKMTDLNLKDMGFEIKKKRKAILFSTGMTLLLVLLMIGIKVVFVKDYDQLFDLSVFRRVETMYYPLTVVVQEILSRGIVHSALEEVFTTKYSSLLAILVSSISFAGLHIHLGLMYMLGAGLLLCVFGFIYKKQRSIWALCIPHYFLCVTAVMLGFM